MYHTFNHYNFYFKPNRLATFYKIADVVEPHENFDPDKHTDASVARNVLLSNIDEMEKNIRDASRGLDLDTSEEKLQYTLLELTELKSKIESEFNVSDRAMIEKKKDLMKNTLVLLKSLAYTEGLEATHFSPPDTVKDIFTVIDNHFEIDWAGGWDFTGFGEDENLYSETETYLKQELIKLALDPANEEIFKKYQDDIATKVDTYLAREDYSEEWGTFDKVQADILLVEIKNQIFTIKETIEVKTSEAEFIAFKHKYDEYKSLFTDFKDDDFENKATEIDKIDKINKGDFNVAVTNVRIKMHEHLKARAPALQGHPFYASPRISTDLKGKINTIIPRPYSTDEEFIQKAREVRQLFEDLDKEEKNNKQLDKYDEFIKGIGALINDINAGTKSGIDIGSDIQMLIVKATNNDLIVDDHEKSIIDTLKAIKTTLESIEDKNKEIDKLTTENTYLKTLVDQLKIENARLTEVTKQVTDALKIIKDLRAELSACRGSTDVSVTKIVIEKCCASCEKLTDPPVKKKDIEDIKKQLEEIKAKLSAPAPNTTVINNSINIVINNITIIQNTINGGVITPPSPVPPRPVSPGPVITPGAITPGHVRPPHKPPSKPDKIKEAFPGSEIKETDEYTPVDEYEVTASELRIRSDNGSTIKIIKKGEKVTIFGNERGKALIREPNGVKFVKIKYGDTIGWCGVNYLKPVPKPEAPKPPETVEKPKENLDSLIQKHNLERSDSETEIVLRARNVNENKQVHYFNSMVQQYVQEFPFLVRNDMETRMKDRLDFTLQKTPLKIVKNVSEKDQVKAFEEAYKKFDEDWKHATNEALEFININAWVDLIMNKTELTKILENKGIKIKSYDRERDEVSFDIKTPSGQPNKKVKILLSEPDKHFNFRIYPDTKNDSHPSKNITVSTFKDLLNEFIK